MPSTPTPPFRAVHEPRPHEIGAAALFVAVDSSTTSCKVFVMDLLGAVIAEGRAPHLLENPDIDAYEQDANGWWEALTTASRTAMAQLSTEERGRLRALSITHQRETFVLTDQRGAPLHRALVWMDARARRQVQECEADFGSEELHGLSGKPACVTPSLYKLRYLLREKAPELAGLSPWLFDVHGFLVWRLTGRRVTSLASADPLGLVDMATRAWSEPLLKLAGLERAQVPRLVEPGALMGSLLPEAAMACDLPEGLAVLAGVGDGQAAGLGAGISAPGAAYLNLGTAVVSGVLSTSYVTDRAFRTLYGATPGTYFLETDLKGGTFTLDWLAQTLLGSGDATTKVERLASLEAEARELPAGADGLMLVPYFCGVMNPYWDDRATGVTLGWQGAHRAAHLYRAILEGIAFEQRLHTSRVTAVTGSGVEEFVVMGGGSQSDLWCQIVADVTQIRVTRAGTSEASALGVAVLAAVSTGHFASFEEAARAMTRKGRAFTAGPAAVLYSSLYEEVYRHLYPTLQPLLHRLEELRCRASTH